jgi:hypothetical protein
VRVAGNLLELGDSTFALEPGAWAKGTFWGEPAAVAGGWEGDSFTAVVRMLETPFSHIGRLGHDGHLSISVDRGFSGPGVVWSGDPEARD